ncbi:hypothetical protein ACIB24_03745 [Spongisporangium articulatum]|uniref:Uncharacterized protein n=1 Tax=Spongisporangium articulatum TaxID=3362603 RepID=A0ABW8AII5_9ACTN
MKAVAITLAAAALAAGTLTAAAPAEASSGCKLPSSSIFRQDVSKLPVRSTVGWQLSPNSAFHPDFGSGTWEGRPFGIPVTKVTSSTPGRTVTFDYASESDRGTYPIPSNVRIEGGKNGDGDRHALLLNTSTCHLAELYYLRPNGSRWLAGSGAKWDVHSNAMRPKGWTSADAAGLPIEPLLVSYADVARGDVQHAIRITMPSTSRSYVWPASHQAGKSGVAGPPMGAYFRLKASVSTRGLGRQATVIAKAMKKYGVVLADNGSAWYLSGTQDGRWDNDDLGTLKRLHGSDFEAVDVSSLKKSSTSYAARA